MNSIPTIKDRADAIYRKLDMAKAMLRSIGQVDFDDDDLTKGIEEMLADARSEAFEIMHSTAALVPVPEMDDRPGAGQPAASAPGDADEAEGGFKGLPPLDADNREKIRNQLTLIRGAAFGFANDTGNDDEGAETCLAIGAAADEALALVFPGRRTHIGADA